MYAADGADITTTTTTTTTTNNNNNNNTYVCSMKWEKFLSRRTQCGKFYTARYTPATNKNASISKLGINSYSLTVDVLV
jgi:hypothetical protein